MINIKPDMGDSPQLQAAYRKVNKDISKQDLRDIKARWRAYKASGGDMGLARWDKFRFASAEEEAEYWHKIRANF